MTIQYLPKFKKQYKKLSQKIQYQFDEKIALFAVDPTLPDLKVHPLKGIFKGYWSMNINGDVRTLHYGWGLDSNFVLIGMRSQL